MRVVGVWSRSARRCIALSVVAVAFGALVLGLFGCASAPTDSGIRGIVTIGPTTPVQRQGESGEAPYQATILVENSRGRKVATVHSGADGHYSVSLAPGDYTLVPQSPGMLPHANTYEATVIVHEYTVVDIQYDSGIR